MDDPFAVETEVCGPGSRVPEGGIVRGSERRAVDGLNPRGACGVQHTVLYEDPVLWCCSAGAAQSGAQIGVTDDHARHPGIRDDLFDVLDACGGLDERLYRHRRRVAQCLADVEKIRGALDFWYHHRCEPTAERGTHGQVVVEPRGAAS